MKMVMVLAPGFEELEAIGTADVLKRLGVELIFAGLKERSVRGTHQITVEADCLFDECKTADFDGIVLPGGLPGAAHLKNSDKVIAFVKELHTANKITAAICAAPIALARAGVLRDGKFTMYPGFEHHLNGLHHTDAQAERDGMVVTGKGPGAIFDFSAKIAEAAGLESKLPELFGGMFVERS